MENGPRLNQTRELATTTHTNMAVVGPVFANQVADYLSNGLVPQGDNASMFSPATQSQMHPDLVFLKHRLDNEDSPSRLRVAVLEHARELVVARAELRQLKVDAQAYGIDQLRWSMQIKALNKKVAGVEREKEELNSNVKAMNINIKAKNEQLEEANADLTTSTAKVADLESKRSEQEDALAEAKRLAESFQLELNLCHKEIMEKINEACNLEKEQKKSRDEVAEKDDQITGLQARLGEFQKA